MLRYDIVLITPLDLSLADRKTVTPHEAAQWSMIVPRAGSYSRQFGETAARRFGVDAEAVIKVGGWGEIKRYVERGFSGAEHLPPRDGSGVGDFVQGFLSSAELLGLHPVEQGSDGARRGMGTVLVLVVGAGAVAALSARGLARRRGVGAGGGWGSLRTRRAVRRCRGGVAPGRGPCGGSARQRPRARCAMRSARKIRARRRQGLSESSTARR